MEDGTKGEESNTETNTDTKTETNTEKNTDTKTETDTKTPSAEDDKKTEKEQRDTLLELYGMKKEGETKTEAETKVEAGKETNTETNTKTETQTEDKGGGDYIHFSKSFPRERAQEIINWCAEQGYDKERTLSVIRGEQLIIGNFLDRNPHLKDMPTADSIKGDKVLGGDAFEGNMTAVKRAISEHGGESTFAELEKSGALYNKEVFSLLVKAGKAAAGDSSPRNTTANQSGGGGEMSAVDALKVTYPSTFK